MTSPDAYLAADRFAKEHPELTAEDIRGMSMSEFAKLTGKEPILPADYVPVSAPALDPVLQDYLDNLIEEPPGEEIQQPEQVPVRDMTPEQYAVYREEIGMGQSGQYGIGILNAVSAPKASNGRHAMVTSNVVPSPAIARVSQVQVNEGNLDARPLAERFGTTSNAYRYEG